MLGSAAESLVALGSRQVCTESVAEQDSSPAMLDANGFSVLNWNLYKGFGMGWQTDLQRMAARSDLLLLQEGYLQEELLDILNAHDLHWNLAAGFAYRDIHSGVLTASRVPAASVCSSRVPEPLLRLPKTAIVTRYPLGETTDILVANVHSINFTVGLKSFQQQLEDIVATLIDHEGPMIMAGDFNTWSQGRMEILARVTKKLGLTSIKLAEDQRTTRFGSPLDHLFYRGLRVQTSHSFEVESSDHNPILVTFRVDHCS